MCGILGWIGTENRPSPALFGNATDLLAHRGPDDRGAFSDDLAQLGHRRLSIIDLSDAGHQPMVNQDSGSVIVFNGEIYNYLELRQELAALGHTFRTDSDTEVLQVAYNQWGENCLGRLNGMFAFAIWDRKRRTVFLARDRFGVKPLNFGMSDGALIFGSEPKALLALEPRWRAANWSVVYEFLQFGSLHASDNSFYEGIQSLLPAHFLTFTVGDAEPRVERYWQYPLMSDTESSGEDCEEQFTELFDDAVALRLRSDVPVGVTLSGGLDSSAILASAIKTPVSSMACFTSVFPDLADNEGVWANKVAREFSLSVEEVAAPPDKWVATLNDISWHMDSPGYSPAVYPLWCLMARAKEIGVPVLLEGQGADEELAGYSHYAVQFLIELAMGGRRGSREHQASSVSSVWSELVENFGRKTTVLWLIRELFPWLVAVRRRKVCAGNVLNRGFVKEIESANDLFEPATEFGNYDRVSTTLWRDHSQTILPGLLHYGDSMSMAHSIEARQPFLDYRLVEWLFRQPTDAKIRNGETKWVLRRYLEKVGLGFIARGRKKVGYLTPEDKWLSDRDYALPRSLLTGSSSVIGEHCSPKALERLFAVHQRGAYGAGNHLYRLVSCELWARNCLQGR